MMLPHRLSIAAALCLFTAAHPRAQAQQSPEAQTLIQRAVQAELAADRDDHSLWRYKMVEKTENAVYQVVDTAHGEVKLKIEQAGKPLAPEEQRDETQKLQHFIHDTHAQARQQRDGEHDDASAQKMLNLLPHAFLWKIAATTPTETTLHFVPDPAFHAPDIESRVLGAMEGDLIVDQKQLRIATIRGKLSHDVEIGFGVLGRLREGGTFNVERRQLAPGIWQITETHVHIDGRALLFKTIGQQTDEIKTGFQPVPPATTLEEAAAILSPR